jgi:hypothetical protein
MNTLALISIGLLSLIAACGGPDHSQRRLRTAVDAQQDALNRCYEKTLKRDAEAAGTMTVTMRVPTNTDGQVDRVEIATRDLESKKLQTCVRNTLLGLRIKPPEDEVRVQYTLKFAPADSAKKAEEEDSESE